MVMCNNVFKTEKIEVKPKIKKSEKYFKHLKENVLLLIWMTLFCLSKEFL